MDAENLIVLKALKGNDPVHETGAQPFLHEHLGFIEGCWWAVFFGTLGFLALDAVRQYFRRK